MNSYLSNVCRVLDDRAVDRAVMAADPEPPLSFTKRWTHSHTSCRTAPPPARGGSTFVVMANDGDFREDNVDRSAAGSAP